MNDECFDSIEERCRYMAQVAKVPAMKNTLTSAADTIEALRRERDTFYMDYRMKCDAETKALYGQLAASQAREQQLRDEAKKGLFGSKSKDDSKKAEYSDIVSDGGLDPRNPK